MSTEQRLDALLREWEERRRRGEPVTPEEVCRDCPELLEAFRRGLAALEAIDRALQQTTPPPGTVSLAETIEGDPGLAPTRSAAPEPLPDVEPRPGAEPIPGFRLVRLLGRGGFGSVWRADAPGGFPVALKFVPLGGKVGASEVQSLAVLRHLRHPNLLSTFGAWRTDSHLIVAMELADRTLADRLNEAKGQGLPGIPLPELLDYLRAAARGIDYLNQPHQLVEGQPPVRVQHRDIKPANILLVGDGVKVADFGLARVLERTLATHSGGLTPAYAAPEFFHGRTSAHSDQYSLAVSYCELRGGRVPFPGTYAEMILGHLEGTPDLSGLPPAERPVVARALSKNPDQRYPSCTAFAEAVARAATGSEPGQGSFRAWLAAVAGLLAVVAFAAAVWQWWPATGGNGEPPDPPKPDPPPPPRVIPIAPPPREVVPGSGPTPPISPRAVLPPPRAAAVPDERFRFALHRPAKVLSAAWVPNSTRVLSGDSGGRMFLWDAATGEAFALAGHTGAVNCLAVSSSGRFALSGGDDRRVRLWNLGEKIGVKDFRKKVLAPGDEEFEFYGVAFSERSQRAVAAGNGNRVIVWDLGTGEEKEAEREKLGLTEVLSLAVTRDGGRALLGGAGGALLLRELAKGGREESYPGHRGDVLAVAFFPDERRFVSAGGGPEETRDYALRVWTVGDSTPRVLRGHADRVGCVAVSPDGRRILSGDASGALRLWDADTGWEHPRFDAPKDGEPPRGAATCVLFAPDGREAVSGHADGTLRVWVLPK
jgi:WD40 repeat protein